ncbi:lipoprotein, putative [Rhodobacteraceae bacterium HTCC2150]|nr:lipoprotein, putative [Rhodobacteraceae bacterium HTCC2150]
MKKSPLILSLLATLFMVAACTETVNSTVQTADGRTVVAKTYRINKNGESRVQYRMLDAVNALRGAKGVPDLVLNAQLNAAAATHSRDMAIQNRPWHFGSDGSSPLDRGKRVGYPGIVRGENISETFETELETLAAWMAEEGTRSVLVDPEAVDMGFSFVQESNGKLWWTLVTGGPGVPQEVSPFAEFVPVNRPKTIETPEAPEPVVGDS